MSNKKIVVTTELYKEFQEKINNIEKRRDTEINEILSIIDKRQIQKIRNEIKK